jgi:hypothetical protein
LDFYWDDDALINDIQALQNKALLLQVILLFISDQNSEEMKKRCKLDDRKDQPADYIS